MLLLSRRQTRAALAAGAGAAVYLAASGLGARKLKLTGLFVVASVSMAGMATAKASAKAMNVERRLNGILNNGVNISGTGVNSITPSKGSFLSTVSQQGHRANLNWSPNVHQGSAPATYSQSYTDNMNSRVSDLIDQLSLASDRCDYTLNNVLLGANLVT